MQRFTIALYLHPVVDAELITALESAPPRGRARLIREWLRGVRPPEDTSPEDARPDLARPDLEGLGIEL